jgi:FKBP-type peptidyl-prolyl cis-trans isomerase
MKRGMSTLGLIVLAAVFVTSCGKAYKDKSSEDTANEQEAQGEPDWVTTNSGLKYLDHVVGDGEEAVNGMTIEMHYTGWLWEDGQRSKKFDSSHDRNQPFSFPLGAGRVIKGWDEGILGMKVGGKRELIIPPELGYGARGFGNVIPPNATLNFEVEFLRVAGK